MRVIFPFRDYVPENAVTPQEAVTSFLGTMASTAGRTSALWRQQLEMALADCPLTLDERRDFFDTHPVEDFYFAGVVALEAVKIRQIYTPAEADALLSEIGAQIDHAADRGDRVLSDMLFELVGRIDLATGPTQQKMPYDLVTKSILQHLEIDQTEATGELMMDKGLRHILGEPLAVGIQNWWAAFATKFVIYMPPERDEPEEDHIPAPPAVAPARRRVKRATALI